MGPTKEVITILSGVIYQVRTEECVGALRTQDVSVAQNELLEARSSYRLGRIVVDNILTVTPVLKSIHHRNDTSPLEM